MQPFHSVVLSDTIYCSAIAADRLYVGFAMRLCELVVLENWKSLVKVECLLKISVSMRPCRLSFVTQGIFRGENYRSEIKIVCFCHVLIFKKIYI